MCAIRQPMDVRAVQLTLHGALPVDYLSKALQLLQRSSKLLRISTSFLSWRRW